MPRNARIFSALPDLRRAVGLWVLLAAVGLRAEDPLQEERIAYRAAQFRLHRKIVNLNHDLNEGVQRPGSRSERVFRQKLTSGVEPRDPEFEGFREVLQFRVFRLTAPEARNDPARLKRIKSDLERDLRQAGSQIGSDRSKRQFRELVCTEMLKALRKVLENNFVARSIAIELLPLMFVTDGRETSPDERQILPAAGETLIRLLRDPEQPDTIKARVAQSMKQYMMRASAGARLEMQFAEAVLETLRSPLPDDDFQVMLLDVLTVVRTPRQPAGDKRPLAFEAAVVVLQDQRRALFVRCAAAEVFGRAGYDRQIRFDPLAWKIAQLTLETGTAFNENPDARLWWFSGDRLFRAFHHAEKERARGPMPDGMLNRAPSSEVVNGAYARILPVVGALIFRHRQIPDQPLKDLAGWVGENRPDDLTYDPAAPPVQP